MNKKGVLAIGTIIVILNIFLASMGVLTIEFLLGQYNLQQKLIIQDQEAGIKCAALVRESVNQEYSRTQDQIDSLATRQINDFFGESSTTTYGGENQKITVCEGGFQNCDLQTQRTAKIICQTSVYAPKEESSQKLDATIVIT